MHPILQRQDEPQNIRKLAAQRALYSNAKGLQNWQIILVVAVPTVLSIISVWYEDLAPYGALFAICTGLADLLGFEREIGKRKQLAAQIQESFDCGVLNIECSIFKASDPQIETVLRHSDALLKVPADAEKLRGWYSAEIESLPVGHARFVCQRTNFRWDSDLRQGFLPFLIWPALALTILPLIIGLTHKIDTSHLVLVEAAILPAVTFFLRQHLQNKESIERLNVLTERFSEFWRKSGETTEAQQAKEARQIQDEIYNHRTQSPLVPDIYYWYRRTMDERNADVAAKTLADEAV